jgi:hypothetical protein
MGGTLAHAKNFGKKFYRSEDGQSHYELVPTDGDYYFPCYSTWEEMKKHSQTLGISPDSWPEFFAFEDAIDLPLEEVERKNTLLRAALVDLSKEAASSNRLLLMIWECIRRGEQIFFC